MCTPNLMYTMELVNNKDNTKLFVANTANAIPTRDGYLDTSNLYRKMLDNNKKLGITTFVDFFHTNVPIGKVIDSVVVGSSLFDIIEIDLNNPIGRYINSEIESNPHGWGFSIEYLPFASGTVENLDGVDVEVFDGDGIRLFVSILPEVLASHHMTEIIDMTNVLDDKFFETLKDRGIPQDEIDRLKGVINQKADDVQSEPNARNNENIESEDVGNDIDDQDSGVQFVTLDQVNQIIAGVLEQKLTPLIDSVNAVQRSFDDNRDGFKALRTSMSRATKRSIDSQANVTPKEVLNDQVSNQNSVPRF